MAKKRSTKKRLRALEQRLTALEREHADLAKRSKKLSKRVERLPDPELIFGKGGFKTFEWIPPGCHYNDALFRADDTGRVASRATTWDEGKAY